MTFEDDETAVEAVLRIDVMRLKQAIANLEVQNTALIMTKAELEEDNFNLRDGYARYVMQASARIADLEAQLAAVRWTRITDDPATWPPETDAQILYWLEENAEANVAWKVRLACAQDAEGGAWVDRNDYWLPITPPQVEP